MFAFHTHLRDLAHACFLASLTLSAHAVIVRGTVRDPLGAAIPLAKVELVQGKKVVAFALSGPNGLYEILSDAQGRFLTLTSANTFALGVSEDFYGGRTEVIARNVTLDPAHITEQVTVTATGTATPLEQVSSAVTLIPTQALETRAFILSELRQSPGVTVVQTGQYGGVTSLFVRGGNSDANKVLIDGIPAEDVGGTFDYGTVTSTGLGSTNNQGAAIELYRGPNSVLYGSDAAASALSLTTTRGTSLRPVFNYSGDAGNLHTYRNEGAVSGAYRRLDYFTAFSRFDTSNALQLDRFHAATAVANLGYDLLPNTQVRFTLRNTDSATGLPGAHDFYGVSNDGKQSDQDLYSGLTLENHFKGNWHNIVRYGVARKREQAAYYGDPVADVVTFTGANGYSATGQAQIFVADRDQASDRDELYYQTDFLFPHRIFGLFGFRYEKERGVFSVPAYGENESIQRTNFQYTLQFQGDIKNRRLLHGLADRSKKIIFMEHLPARLASGLPMRPCRPSARKLVPRHSSLRFNLSLRACRSRTLQFAVWQQLLSEYLCKLAGIHGGHRGSYNDDAS